MTFASVGLLEDFLDNGFFYVGGDWLVVRVVGWCFGGLFYWLSCDVGGNVVVEDFLNLGCEELGFIGGGVLQVVRYLLGEEVFEFLPGLLGEFLVAPFLACAAK